MFVRDRVQRSGNSVRSDTERTVSDERRSRITIAYPFVGPLVALVDVTIIISTTIIGDALYHTAIAAAKKPDLSFGIGVLISVAYVLAAWRFGLYSIFRLEKLVRDRSRVIASCHAAYLFVIFTLFLLKATEAISRGAMMTGFVICFALLLFWRHVAKDWIRSALLSGAIRGQRVMLLGTADELSTVSRDYLLLTYGANEIGRITIPPGPRESIGILEGPPAGIKMVLENARARSADGIILALAENDTANLELFRGYLRDTPLPVRLLPGRIIRGFLEPSVGRINLFDIQRSPLNPTEQWLKRIFDVVVASGMLIILSPLMLITAVAIKLDSPGPVFFRQRRHGFNGREFVILKFRTMNVSQDGPYVPQAIKGDERLTKLGAILRRYSVDELPQFINVLSGEMSIVGPRPHALAHNGEFGELIAQYAFRHHVKPGITGWAQVNGCRGPTPSLEPMRKRIEYDIWYIANWNFWLDVRILMKTIFELARPSQTAL